MTPQQSADLHKRSIMLHTGALEYLVKHQHDSVPLGSATILQRCTAYLVDKFEVSSYTAENATIIALGELQAVKNAPYIDCSKTTSHMLFLIDPATRTTRAIPVADIVEYVP